MIDTAEVFLAIDSIRKNEKKKPSKVKSSNIYKRIKNTKS